ncbi:MAG: hypothetical protein Kow0068_24440 [Marinilabiliales bacterium]
MEEQVQAPKPLKGFAIAGIICAAIGLLFSLLAFAGGALSWMAALSWYFAGPGFILGILGLIFASRAKAPKGLSIAVIIIAIVANGLGYYGVQKTASAIEDLSGDLDEWQQALDEATEDLNNVE